MNSSTFNATTRLLDYKLQPIFTHIRKRNINNVHQLQAHNSLETDEIDLNATTLPIFYKTERLIKLQSLKLKAPPQRMDYFKRRDSLNRNQKSQSSKNSSRQKVYFVSPSSKVKKHLIETIDFKGIEKVLFKPQQRRTVYQQFYETIMQKDRRFKKKHPGLFKTVSVDSKPTKRHNEAVDNGEAEGKNSSMRGVAKKISQKSIDRQRISKLQSAVLQSK